MTDTGTILREGAIADLATLQWFSQSRRVFVVVDETAYQCSGAAAALESFWLSNSPTFFSDFRTNPHWEDVATGIQQYRRSRAELVIAIGGGTAIDVAKLIRALAMPGGRSDDDCWSVVLGHSPLVPDAVPLIAIPTTAGTGSEATQFAVVYRDGKKHSLDDPLLLPQAAIIDPLLMHSLPREITVATGLDAFCQAVESVWSVAADDRSLPLALEAARLAFDHLPTAAKGTPDDSMTCVTQREARHAMCRAAHLAGQAINRTRTTACHALSYSITSQHGIPHGVAVALTLLPILQFNGQVTDQDCIDPRGADAVRSRIARLLTTLSIGSMTEAQATLGNWMHTLGCPRSLTETGIGDPATVQQIAQAVDLRRLANNPRRLSFENLQSLLVAT